LKLILILFLALFLRELSRALSKQAPPERTRTWNWAARPVDPIRAAREAERRQIRDEKRAERYAVARAKERNYVCMVECYAAYIADLQAEYNDSNTSLSRQAQISKEIVRIQEKAVKAQTQADAAHAAAAALTE